MVVQNWIIDEKAKDCGRRVSFVELKSQQLIAFMAKNSFLNVNEISLNRFRAREKSRRGAFARNVDEDRCRESFVEFRSIDNEVIGVCKNECNIVCHEILISKISNQRAQLRLVDASAVEEKCSLWTCRIDQSCNLYAYQAPMLFVILFHDLIHSFS